MKKARGLFSIGVTIFIFSLFLIACTSSKNAGGFQYHSRVVAPDAAMGNEPPKTPQITDYANQAKPEENTYVNGRVLPDFPVPSEKKEKFGQVEKTFREAWKSNAKSAEPVTNRELMKQVTRKLEKDGTIEPLSRKDSRKLDKLAAKMDRKMQSSEFDILDNTNTEWFFLIMAAIGLVVGIFGVWFGWIVFLVFGGLYVYFKLLK